MSHTDPVKYHSRHGAVGERESVLLQYLSRAHYLIHKKGGLGLFFRQCRIDKKNMNETYKSGELDLIVREYNK